LETPCGWHLIGTSPVPLWRIGRDATPLLNPGDKVRFDPISLDAYQRWLEIVRDGNFELCPVHEAWDVAA
jgi:inhibitor of KinA